MILSVSLSALGRAGCAGYSHLPVPTVKHYAMFCVCVGWCVRVRVCVRARVFVCVCGIMPVSMSVNAHADVSSPTAKK